jgi:isopenicillin N synthase-like dioxygenase
MKVPSSVSMLLGVVAVLPTTTVWANITTRKVVSVDYQELAAAFQGNNNDEDDDDDDACPQHLLTAVSEAFGPNGLGFLEVSNIPQAIVELRTTVLSQAPKIANLPAEELDALTLPDKDYTIGWSHGKEQFGVDSATGEPIYDNRKGSFYLDPFRENTNVFPRSSLPSLEPALLEVTHSMSQVALWVSKLCDAYLQRQDDDDMIYTSLESRINTKARLLYYFPNNEEEASSSSSSEDDWCGWHKDHGSLTALLPGMLWNESPPPSSSSNNNNHRKPGLYIQTRDGNQIHVQLPPTSIGIQVGETVEVMSGGRLVATPHAVMSSPTLMGGRASLAVFLQPELGQPLPECPVTADDSLRTRYRPTFGAFQEATTKAFQ